MSIQEIRRGRIGSVARMTIQRMDHVGIVVADLDAAVAFFAELGLAPCGDAALDDPAVGRIIGLPGARTRFTMMETPDGKSRLELIAYDAPASPAGDPQAGAHVPGLRHLCFAVDDLADTLARLEPHGAELVGDVVDWGTSFRLCYLRGPEGIIVELAQPLS